ncbi:hypothetical protein ACJ72_08230 [Emergomyces africanus]|uniref:Uncharacterized protein n=1 Tax=Emergomyces africanus TaxID=1955775 RepID=A0A1B7NLK8_9EURO|nr:hypothetical protein ACJ72_08230 [Emergomyces africanus]
MPARHHTSGTRNTRNYDLVMPYIMADPNDDVVLPAAVVENEKRTTAGGYFHRQENIVRGRFAEHSSSVVVPPTATLEPGRPGRDNFQHVLDGEN